MSLPLTTGALATPKLESVRARLVRPHVEDEAAYGSMWNYPSDIEQAAVMVQEASAGTRSLTFSIAL